LLPGGAILPERGDISPTPQLGLIGAETTGDGSARGMKTEKTEPWPFWL